MQQERRICLLECLEKNKAKISNFNQQIDEVATQNERRVIKNAMNELLLTNPLHLEKINSKIFINEFTNRADFLRINWYKPFSLIRITEPLLCP
jgi:hypothetical protein